VQWQRQSWAADLARNKMRGVAAILEEVSVFLPDNPQAYSLAVIKQ
jgi:hypothetical protein